MKKAAFILTILAIGCTLHGCGISLYVPASPDPETQQQLVQGRKLYIEHCSGCHNLYLPKRFSPEKWTVQLNEMQRKAKITDLEKGLIFQYLTSQPEQKTGQ